MGILEKIKFKAHLVLYTGDELVITSGQREVKDPNGNILQHKTKEVHIIRERDSACLEVVDFKDVKES